MAQKAVTETIRICKDRNVLREYLAQRKKEVVTIMMSLFDEEQIMKSFIRSERHDADRETAERMINIKTTRICGCVWKGAWNYPSGECTMAVQKTEGS